MPAWSLDFADRSLGRRLSKAVAFGGLAGLVASSFACRGDDLFFDCEQQEEAFRTVAEGEGVLRDPIPMGGPWPVAISFSQEGINTLLESVVGENVPFTGSLPFFWFTGPSTIHFEQTSEPVLELVDLEGCKNCIQMSFDFSANMVGPNNEPNGAGIGAVNFRVPLMLESVDDTSTTLIADYSRLRVQEFQLSAFGLNDEEHPGLVGALGALLEEEIQANYGQTELLRLESWDLGEPPPDPGDGDGDGDGDSSAGEPIRLLARKLYVFPETNTLTLAMQSNLPLPSGGGLELDGDIAMGVKMKVEFHADLFEAMTQRLLASGQIPRVYNEDGEPDPDGNYGVTIEDISGEDSGQNRLDARFRVWRFSDGYCGYAVADMDIDAELNMETNAVELSPGDVVVIAGEGSGAVAAQEDELVEQNQQVVEQFKSDLADNLGSTINYDGLGLAGSSIIFQTVALDVEPDSLETWFDFFVVENP